MWSAADYRCMAQAIQLAKRGDCTCAPNPKVGCVIVQGARQYVGWHIRCGEAHAEINALAEIDDPSGAEVYVSLEPCAHSGLTPPCVDALIEAKVAKVTVAMVDPNPLVSGSGIAKLESAGIQVRQGLLAEEAHAINIGFFKRMRSGMPYVRCKMAMSFDGHTALHNGESRWISSPQSRRDVHLWRARSDAIITGANTIVRDDPQFTVRDVDLDFKPPIPVILDRRLRTPPTAKLFECHKEVIIYTQTSMTDELSDIGATVIVVPDSHAWLSDVLRDLAKRYQINDVLIETGAQLSGAFLEAGLVDELMVYMAPILLGNTAMPLFYLQTFENLDEPISLEPLDVRQIGKDWRFRFKPHLSEIKSI